MARSRQLPLRWHLVLLVVGALLPVIAFGAMVVLRLAGQEQALVQRRLVSSATMVATLLDYEMSATVRTLQTLAESVHLDRGDLEAFHAEARRASGTQPSWMTVLLLAPDGRQLVNAMVDCGTPLLKVNEVESLRKVLETGQPVVGNLAVGRYEGRWGFPVRVPVIRGGELRYVLTAVIPPSALADVVEARAPLQGDWARVIVDGRGAVAARSGEIDYEVGGPGDAALLQRVQAEPQGLYRDVARDGDDAYIAYRRAASGWTTALVVPVDVVEGPVRQSILTIVGVGLALLLLSGIGASFLGRRLARGIASAAAAADALAHGDPPQVEGSRIVEVARLADALKGSAALLERREHERLENLARAEAARAEAETANRAKDEFLAMLGHELRNPLAPIVTGLQLLELRGEGKTREHDIIRRQVKHLVRLVDDLLDVSRITRGKVVLEREGLELSTVVAKAVEMASPLLEQRRHELVVDVPRSGLVVDGDPVRLAQVVANLLTNAARYTPPGGHVEVHATRMDDEVVLEVRDDGQGLSADLLPRVFDLFVQGARTSDRQEGGLGIGLTLVRSLVALHGGRVDARSDGPGRGSTFRVTLPTYAPVAVTGETQVLTEGVERAPRPLRVLVVDDNTDAADLVGLLFTARGHLVTIAHDGPTALAALDRFAPEVAILDIGLPVMDGYELAQRIRDRMGDEAPVLMALTGYGADSDRARSRAAGFARHFVKPVDPVLLRTEVEEVGITVRVA